MSRAEHVVTSELVQAWQRDGAVCLCQLLARAEVAQLRRGIDANLAAVRRHSTLEFVAGTLALHASAGVDGDVRRRVFSARFTGDDIRHAPRRWKTSPAFPALAGDLLAGAPMAHALFPLLIGGQA